MVAAVLLPDASYYWLANAFLRPHWLLQVGCGGLYGVTTATLSVVLLQQWSRHRSWRALLGAGACGMATFWFKAQIFIVLMPCACRPGHPLVAGRLSGPATGPGHGCDGHWGGGWRRR